VKLRDDSEVQALNKVEELARRGLGIDIRGRGSRSIETGKDDGLASGDDREEGDAETDIPAFGGSGNKESSKADTSPYGRAIGKGLGSFNSRSTKNRNSLQ